MQVKKNAMFLTFTNSCFINGPFITSIQYVYYEFHWIKSGKLKAITEATVLTQMHVPILIDPFATVIEYSYEIEKRRENKIVRINGRNMTF